MPVPHPRIASLLPAGTEMVAALGAEDLLTGISHECDFPASIARLPRLTASPIDSSRSSGAIDAQVRAVQAGGHPVITVDLDALDEARPDLVLSQDLCEVCAVVDGDLRSLALVMAHPPRIVSLGARTLPGIFEDIHAVGVAIGREDEARAVNLALEARLRALASTAPPRRPRVVVVEWLEPLYLAGHWVPEMVTAAGGVDVGAAPGDHSHPGSWLSVAGLAPDVMLVALCGFGLDRAVSEWKRFLAEGSAEALAAAKIAVPVWAIDGNAFTSRPGPRVVDGAELIQRALLDRATNGLVRLG